MNITEMAEIMIDNVGVTETLKAMADICEKKSKIIDKKNPLIAKEWGKASSDLLQFERTIKRHRNLDVRDIEDIVDVGNVTNW